MAHDSTPLLPCDGDGLCMRCKVQPPEEEKLTCKTCVTPWHVACLASSHCPETLLSAGQWECPDCKCLSGGDVPPVGGGNGSGNGGGDLVAKIRAIEGDARLTEREKAVRRQELLSGKVEIGDTEKKKKDVLDFIGGSLNCSFCLQLPERPVTAPCGHNFCLKCFQKWVGQGKRTCAKCRSSIPSRMANNPRINSTLVGAIRMAKLSKSIVNGGPLKVNHFVHNQDRPDKAYTTDRAKKNGKANAASGKIFVTVPPDHFGPIPAENDPERNQGVLVGECWEDRLECRQWGAHLPHVAGIAGKAEYGSQSVALSGGYQDDEDHGEWFLYTGSGGRDLTGNKRTNKDQSFDQTFEKNNEALRLSCKKGYPVRVVRSHKEKRSAYAPEKGVRYDGIYRVEKCWRKIGIQGFRVCRYLLVRCDNDPAPWTSDEHGDRPRPLPSIPELKKATDIIERKERPFWDFSVEENLWRWMKPPPASQKAVNTADPEDTKRVRKAIRKSQNMSVREKLLKGFSCLICRQVMALPVTTPCAHNFCKACLEDAFAGKSSVRERSKGGRTLRAQKIVLSCPSCPIDIADFLKDPQVNRDLMDVIEALKSQAEENEESVEKSNEAEEKAYIKDDEAKGTTESVENDSEEANKIIAEKSDLGEQNNLKPQAAVGTKRKKASTDGHSPKQAKGAKTKRTQNTPNAANEESH